MWAFRPDWVELVSRSCHGNWRLEDDFEGWVLYNPKRRGGVLHEVYEIGFWSTCCFLAVCNTCTVDYCYLQGVSLHFLSVVHREFV